ncbi:NB-ARC domains-containing protein [Artemisia annua]|uniref:NB-ARC domains-containing protein n=1 Tax=Artemisia annua TaxID=35608 RepID=A0A2U1N2W7_ARTAN|nr:NB-ARC domains-containing protein [Artemisia annua]
MEQLEKTVADKKVFGWIIKVVIGQKINTFSIQQTIAEYIGLNLTEMSETARRDRLRITFEKMSQEGKKVLVILDDMWETVKLKDIGLSPLPTGFKLLLTSRNETVCKQIAVEANSDVKVVRVDVMEESEANNFFCQITGVSKESDPGLNEIGNQIVKRCGFLPLAIKLIATTLKSQEICVWRDTLNRLKNNDLGKNVQEIIEFSYTSIREEDVKAIFLLCGLFPDDFNIPIEHLTRYAWGLKLLKGVPTLGDARDRTKTCVRKLKNANLLIDSDYLECVKMHDLVLTFVQGEVSKGDHPWFINHGDISRWSGAEMSRSCQKISLTCMGMTEFPKEFKCPNLTLLRLKGGDRTLEFPEDFYEGMENLEVIVYEKMEYPLLPRSLQCSTNLRTLILHQCLLMFDCSSIGDLLNLEVLSFANCGIQKLPGTIGNLKKLKQLDLTGCVDLHIDEGVFKSLVKLEELYMRVSRGERINFTDANFNELAQCSRNLSALEIEFFENKAQLKNMSFKKLERFRISVGSVGEMEYSKENSKSMHSFENTLNLITTKDELMESRLNELFPKTEVLFLEANGMNDLVELSVASFYKLRELQISNSADLEHLFTVPVAEGLVKLERLTIMKCPVMAVVASSDNGAQGVIKFQELKFLYLSELPMLVGFCNTISLIELPQLEELILHSLPKSSAIQPFLSKKVVILKLETLRVFKMEALQNIWPYHFCSIGEVNSCILREIEVSECDNLVNLFPSNPMPLLHHLIDLRVHDCGGSGEIREVWRLKGVSNPDVIIRGFQAVKRIEIYRCKSFRNLFTPTFARFDLGALEYLDFGALEYLERSHEMNDINRGEILQVDIIPDFNVAFPFHVLSRFHHLRNLRISCRADVEVAFEIESATSKDLARSQRDNQQSPLLPYLESLGLQGMDLEQIHISDCDAIEEVVSNRDGEYEEIATSSQTNTTLLPRFDYLHLHKLSHLKLIDGTDSNFTASTNSIHDHFKCSQVGFASPSLCQYSRKIKIDRCETLATLIPFSAVGKLQKLEELQISSCQSLREIFEIKRVNKNGSDSANVGDEIGDILPGVTIPRSANMTLLELPNLKILQIFKCDLLEHVFTSSTLDSLKQLKELTIKECNAMQVIVKDDEHHDSKIVNIYGCPKMMTFTSGRSMTPKLLYIHTGIGKRSLECGLNFPLSNASHEEIEFHSSSMCSNQNIIKLLQFPWSFSNLVEVNGKMHPQLLKSGIIFRCNELINLQNLEKLHIRKNYRQSSSSWFIQTSIKEVKEIFEVVDLENDDVNEKQSVVSITATRA